MPAIDWPIYVINLDRAVERRAAITERMSRARLSFERFAAIDATTLIAAQIRESVAADQIKRFKRPLSRPEIACYLSHIAVWQKIASGDKPAAFIFEDDAVPGDDAPRILEAVSTRRPDWDVLWLQHDRNVTLIDSTILAPGYRYGVPYPRPVQTFAYAVTRNAAAKLAALAVPFAMPIDLEFRLWWRFNACMKVVLPSPFYPARGHLSSSEISTGRVEHRSQPVWLRFVRNSRFQLGFRFRWMWYRRRIPRRPAWPQLSDRSPRPNAKSAIGSLRQALIPCLRTPPGTD